MPAYITVHYLMSFLEL